MPTCTSLDCRRNLESKDIPLYCVKNEMQTYYLICFFMQKEVVFLCYWCQTYRKICVYYLYLYTCRGAKVIIHTGICFSTVCSILEKQTTETRKLHLYSRQTVMPCRVKAALPCRHIAKASFLSRTFHESKWFSISPDFRQNSSLKCATLQEMKHRTYILGCQR